ncbi:unnamed protein product, partial [Prorocentrum cordatum]
SRTVGEHCRGAFSLTQDRSLWHHRPPARPQGQAPTLRHPARLQGQLSAPASLQGQAPPKLRTSVTRCISDVADASAPSARRKSGATSSRIAEASARRRDPPTPSARTTSRSPRIRSRCGPAPGLQPDLQPRAGSGAAGRAHSGGNSQQPPAYHLAGSPSWAHSLTNAPTVHEAPKICYRSPLAWPPARPPRADSAAPPRRRHASSRGGGGGRPPSQARDAGARPQATAPKTEPPEERGRAREAR